MTSPLRRGGGAEGRTGPAGSVVVAGAIEDGIADVRVDVPTELEDRVAQDVVGWVQGRVGDHAQLDGGVGSSMVEVEPLD